MKEKVISIFVVLVMIVLVFSGCVEDDTMSIKYQSFEQITSSSKQGRISMNFSIITNNTTESVR